MVSNSRLNVLQMADAVNNIIDFVLINRSIWGLINSPSYHSYTPPGDLSDKHFALSGWRYTYVRERVRLATSPPAHQIPFHLLYRPCLLLTTIFFSLFITRAYVHACTFRRKRDFICGVINPGYIIVKATLPIKRDNTRWSINLLEGSFRYHCCCRFFSFPSYVRL